MHLRAVTIPVNFYGRGLLVCEQVCSCELNALSWTRGGEFWNFGVGLCGGVVGCWYIWKSMCFSSEASLVCVNLRCSGSRFFMVLGCNQMNAVSNGRF